MTAAAPPLFSGDVANGAARAIAHDLNNLLGAILGFATFIIEDCGPDHVASAHARRILNVSDRGKRIVRRVLELCPAGAEAMLPLPPETATARYPTSCRRQGRVLLIEDDIDYGDMLTMALERRGVEVAPCPSSADALTALRRNPGLWSLVISDLSMIGDGPVAFVEEVKAIRPDLPTVICTGMGEELDLEATARQVGVAAIVRKPSTMQTIDEVLRMAVGGSD